MSDRSGGAEFFAGLMIGGLIGAAIALLMAPQSGEETRAQIRDRSVELKDRAEESMADARARGEAIVADARARADAIVAEARHRSEEIQQQARERAAQLQEQGRTKLEAQTGKVKDVASKAKDSVAKVTHRDETSAGDVAEA